MKLYIYVLTTAFFIFGCSGSKPMVDAGSAPIPKFQQSDRPLSVDEIEAVIINAETKRIKAAELGHEWRHTKKIIKNAQKQLADGELEKAQKNAEKALHEAKMAIWQYGEAKLFWKIAVP